MKDYLAKLIRRGEIIIQADNAEEAASIAARLDSASWNNSEFNIEVTSKEANRNGKSCVKHAIAKRNKKMRKYLDDYDIPF